MNDSLFQELPLKAKKRKISNKMRFNVLRATHDPPSIGNIHTQNTFRWNRNPVAGYISPGGKSENWNHRIAHLSFPLNFK